MNKLMAPITSCLAALVAETATAASPAYCALYAREFAIQIVQPRAAPGMHKSVQDQAYYRCLNQDEEPALPSSSAYFGADIGVGGKGDAVERISEGDISVDEPVGATPDDPAPPAGPVKAGRRYRGSGLTAWTPEWAAWCSRHFPNSFDPKAGTVLPYSSSKRRFCY